MMTLLEKQIQALAVLRSTKALQVAKQKAIEDLGMVTKLFKRGYGLDHSIEWIDTTVEVSDITRAVRMLEQCIGHLDKSEKIAIVILRKKTAKVSGQITREELKQLL